MRISNLLGAMGVCLALQGCAEAESFSDEDDGAGLTQAEAFTTFERALHLVPDTKVDGKWLHDKELKNGICHRRLMTGTNEGKFTFRRYTRGGAFFRKSSAGAKVECIDFEFEKGQMALSGTGLDLAMRYNFGAPIDARWGDPHDRYDFARGRMTVWRTNANSKGTEDAIDHASTGRAEIDQIDFVDPVTGKRTGSISSEAAYLIHRYAHPLSQGPNEWDVGADRVGRFLGQENSALRFEKVDVHLRTVGDIETLYITRKNRDANVEGSAIAKCARSWPLRQGAGPFVCRGLD